MHQQYRPVEIDTAFYLIFIIFIIVLKSLFLQQISTDFSVYIYCICYYYINADLCSLYCASIGACFGNSSCSSPVTNQANG